MVYFIKKIKTAISHKNMERKDAAVSLVLRSRNIFAANSGEGYIDTAIKILIAVVLGALLLAGLYALFGETVLPTLRQRIMEMFNYAG